MAVRTISTVSRTAALFAGLLALVVSSGFASAQYSPRGGYSDDRPRYRDDRPRYRDDRPRFRDDRPRYRERADVSGVCVTSRGNCRIVPSRVGSACRCDIPGFGRKRGSVAGY
jgi:hypothetical protein